MENGPKSDVEACIPPSDLSVNGGTKKKRGSFSFFKSALVMMRRQSSSKSKKPINVEAGPNDTIKKIVGSMRPLHLQDNESPPHEKSPAKEIDDQNLLPPMSPMWPGSPASSSTGGMSRYASVDNLQDLDRGRESRYASALNLQALDNDETDEESDDGFDDNGGDEMIDAKAEAFIAHFYHQMSLQHVRRHNHHHHHN